MLDVARFRTNIDKCEKMEGSEQEVSWCVCYHRCPTLPFPSLGHPIPPTASCSSSNCSTPHLPQGCRRASEWPLSKTRTILTCQQISRHQQQHLNLWDGKITFCRISPTQVWVAGTGWMAETKQHFGCLKFKSVASGKNTVLIAWTSFPHSIYMLGI